MDMDLKCKKLILMTMKMNNAHQQKLKFSSKYIVNLAMFFRVSISNTIEIVIMRKYKSIFIDLHIKILTIQVA